MNKKTIFIVGSSNHHNTLSMVRCIGEAGYNVELISIDSAKGCATKSKYVSHVWTMPNMDKFIPFLLENNSDLDDKIVIISCCDEAACLMDLHYGELKDNYIFFHTVEEGKLSRYMDKKLQTELARNVGFEVPLSKVYLGEENFQFERYPCILKPLESIKGGKKIKICNSQDDLNKELLFFAEGGKVLVQEYIKRENEYVIVGLSKGKDIVIPAYVKKIRDNKGGTTYCEVKGIDTFKNYALQYCKELITRIGYHGLFGIELISSNDKLYFIEVNLRNDATCYAIAKAGVNLPLRYIKEVAKKNGQVGAQKIREIHSMVELKDLKFVLKGKVSPFKWICQLKNSECKYYFDRNDIKPFLFAIREILTRPFH